MSIIHLRKSTEKTACGIALWVANLEGKTVASVDSVGGTGIPGLPVTCPACRADAAEDRMLRPESETR